MENVLSMVAAKPLYHPARPSSLRILSRTGSIDASALFPLPLLVDACIRVFALIARSILEKCQSHRALTRLEGIPRCEFEGSVNNGNLETIQRRTHC